MIAARSRRSAMSTSKGSTVRRRPQKHQNRSAFKNDLHDTSQKTKFLNSMGVNGVCRRCKDIIDWKIKYKKYKPLSAPKKCITCDQKAIKQAYHVLCRNCARTKDVCAKCCKPEEVIAESSETNKNEADIAAMLKTLPERKRRTILRYISKNQDGDQKVTPEMMVHIEDLLAKMDQVKIGDDGEFDFSSNDDNNIEPESDEE